MAIIQDFMAQTMSARMSHQRQSFQLNSSSVSREKYRKIDSNDRVMRNDRESTR